MSQFVSCPRCKRRARIPDALLGRQVKCPGCSTTFTATPSAPAPGPEKEESAKKKPAAGREETYEVADDAGEHRGPRHHRDDDEEDEERPRRRRKKKRAQSESDGPWPVAIMATGGCLVLSFLTTLLSLGTAGLPVSSEGLGMKLLALAVGLVVSLVLMGVGTVGVKNRVVYGRGVPVTGMFAVIVSMIVTATGGGLCGFILYGLLFTLLRGR
jgi:hypothetical protein